MTTEAPTVKVGDVFYTSWGYDQTNVDFYVVLSVTPSGKTAKLQKCARAVVAGKGVIALPDQLVNEHGDWCVNCRKPISIGRYGSTKGFLIHSRSDTTDCLDSDGVPTGTKAKRARPVIYTRRIKTYGDGPVLSWDHHIAWPWSGSPKYDTRALGYEGH